MQTVQRYDRGHIDGYERTPSGALRVRARLARIGVQEYQGADGRMHGELRLPAEVFASDSLATYRSAALTELHPTTPITPANWRDLSVGHVAEDAHADGDWVVATLVIHHGPTIESVLARKLREISCGYECGLEPNVGTYAGARHEYAQRSIRINHVALGPANWARAGREASILLDHAAARKTRSAVVRFDGGLRMANRYKLLEIDGAELRFDGRVFNTSKPEDMSACREAVLAHVRAATPRADQLDPAAVQPILDEMQGMIVGLSDKLMQLAAMAAEETEMPTDPEGMEEMLGAETMDTLVKARAEVVDKAKRIAPDLKTDGMPTTKIRREALKAAGREVSDKDSDEFVKGLFAGLSVTTFSARDSAIIESGGAAGGDVTDLTKVKAERRKRNAAAWKTGK